MSSQNNGASRAMLGLTYGEHFIIWSLRRIIAERGPDGRLLDECMSAFDEDGEAGLRVLSVFLGLLGRAARRTFEVGSPETLFITWDERAILALLGAAQEATGRGRSALLDAHLRWLSKPLHRPELAQAAISLARLLVVHGHRIVPEAAETPAPAEVDNGFKLGLVAQDSGVGVGIRISGNADIWIRGEAAARPR